MNQEELNEELLVAAGGGDTKSVEDWVARGANVNCKDGLGRSPLHLAALWGHTETVSRLVELGGDVNSKNMGGWSPLHLASQWGHTETVSRLVELGGNINVKDVVSGWSPLHLAAERGHTETVSRLVELGGDVNSKKKSGWSPLHLAAWRGHTETVSRLVELGGDINSKDNKGQTPYDVSRKDDIKELLKKCIEQQKQLEQAMKELRGLGMETVEEFQDIIKEGSYKCFWNRIYLVGPYAVGKSTLARILVGEPIPTERESTDGIWIYMGRAGMEVEQQKWKFFPKGTAIKEILASLLMSVTNDNSQNLTRDDAINLNKVTPHLEMSTAGRNQTQIALQSAMSTIDSSQKEKLEDTAVTYQSAVSPMDSSQKEKLEDTPVTYQSAVSPMDSSQKEKLKDTPVTYQSAMSTMDSSQKEKLVDTPVTYLSAMSPMDSSQKEKLEDTPVTYLSAVSPMDSSQKEKLEDTPVTYQSAVSPMDSSQKEKLEDTPVTYQSAVSPMDSSQKEKLEASPVTYQSAVSPMDSSQKEKLEDTPVTYQSAVSPMDSSQKEKLEDTPVTYQSAVSPMDSSQKEKLEASPVTYQSAVSPMDSSQKEKLEDTPVTYQSAVSPMDSSQKEKLEASPVTYQSAVSPMDSSQKEKLENVPVTHQSAMSPMDSSQKEKLEDAPVTYQSAVSPMDSSQKEKLEDTPVTYQSAVSPMDSSQKEKLEDTPVTYQSAVSPVDSSQKEKLEDTPGTYQSAVSPTDSSQIDNTKNDLFLDQSAKLPIRVPQSEQFIDVPSAAEFIPVLSNYKTLDKRSEINKPFSSMSNTKIHDLVIQAIQDGKYRQKIIPIDIWDFGGQKDYYMTHQLFITSRGIYVLMFNGSVDIHKIMKDLGFLPGHFGRPTVAVYLLHWVNSILTYCKRTNDGFPRIIFVATHKDKILQSKIELQRKKLMDSIYDLFKSHAGIKHLEFKPLIFINAKDSMDNEIDILQRRLIQRAVQHPRWGEKMPTAWVPLELQLAEKVEEGTNIISMAELDILNSQNTPMVLNQKQLNTFLKVQHSLGKLLYFDAAKLRDFIIINPAYMVGVLRSIVTEKQFWPKGEEYSSVLKQLQKTGKIRCDDIYLLWAQKHFQHILPHKEHMVQMLTHLDILVAPRATFDDVVDSTTTSIDIGNRDFLVPCMIMEPNSTHYIKNSCIPTKTIILAYTFFEEIIPPALAYRFLGSFITMCGVKIYKGRSMLFSDLAVVEINDTHDVTVQVQGNRVVVSLVHSNRKEHILPTLASSIQACLTASVHRISEFYSTLSGDGEKAAKTTMPFNIEFGVLCNKGFFETTWCICFFSQRELMKSSWTCPVHNRKHDIQSLHLWFTDKVALERCIDTCTGLGRLERDLAPSDKHLCRLASMLTVDICRHLVIHLGLTAHVWEQLEYQFQNQNPVNMMFTALIKWKRSQHEPTFSMLQNALEDCGNDVHKLCQVFRDIIPYTSGLTEETLSKKPTYKALQSLLDHIGDSVMELGVELGLDFSEIERIQYEYKNKLLDQARAVLKRWMEQSRPTVRTIVKALHRIGKISCIQQVEF